MKYPALLFAAFLIFTSSLSSVSNAGQFEDDYKLHIAEAAVCIKLEATKLAPSNEKAELLADIIMEECVKYLDKAIKSFVLLNVSEDSPDELNNFYAKFRPIAEEEFRKEAIKAAVRAKARLAN